VTNYSILYTQAKNLSLLLVEDYEPLRSDMLEILDEFYDVVTIAENGKDGLRLYKEYYEEHHQYFDIVISDIQMPVMNGIELSKKIKEINSDQQIIVLSAHTDSEYLLELINFGIAQFITKPIDHYKLLDTLYFVGTKIVDTEIEKRDQSIMKLTELFSWDSEKDLLKCGDKPIELTQHEIILMRLLVKKSHQICTNDDIIEEFYINNVDLSQKNIRNLVFKLRKKLSKNLINSIYGMGYKFTPTP
jgi:DNA-binding response OmpR family regulator